MVAVGEHLGLVGQVGAAGIDQIDAGQVVLFGDLLRPQVLLHGHREVGAALHRRIVGDDHDLAARDPADAADHARARSAVGSLASPYMPLAVSWPTSRKGEPGSSSRSTRSRGSSFPRDKVRRSRDAVPRSSDTRCGAGLAHAAPISSRPIRTSGGSRWCPRRCRQLGIAEEAARPASPWCSPPRPGPGSPHPRPSPRFRWRAGSRPPRRTASCGPRRRLLATA
jgi:hypothetical protein